MMKLVISFDEIGIPNPELIDEESAFDMVIDFLENQFPNWDSDMAFDFNNADWDFTNNEIHIPMNVI